ncbi:MAG: TonB-dependent receptor [Brevundimonas sp.]|nr:TonB-dependent receptor [Brevundimonas sp.]
MKTQTIRQRLLQSTMIGSAALLALSAVPAVLAPTPALAQSQTGSLRVTISGETGQPLAGATVRVSSPDSLVSRTGVTAADGSVRLVNLDPSTRYSVEVSADGYDAFTATNVAVVSGRELSLGYALGVASLDDVIVTGTSLAAVDVTSATVSTTLTLDTVESLPTGRSYQSYLQLVPGTKPGSNPSSRSGVNYSDVGGSIGSSTDNLYYLDGVDVTDPSTGTFGANFNSEIIQEQQVLVGAVPAEYAGGSGLISRVITKSGSNEWHGSLNYYFQNDGLVANDKHSTSGGFSTYDTAFTLGGPILRDRLWIFASYQKTNREDEVLDITNGNVLRSVEIDQEYTFAKLTWQITNDDRLSVSFFNDPYESTGQNSAAILNNRDYRRIQGGDNWKVEYSRNWGDLSFNAYWFRHEGEVSNIAANTTVADTVIYPTSANSTLAQRALGGLGSNIETFRNRDEYGLNLEYFMETGFGTHTLKAGYISSENVYAENGSVPGGARYSSLAIGSAGGTFASVLLASSGWTSRPALNSQDTLRVIAALDRPEYAATKVLVDTNADGVVSTAEVNAIVFNNTAGNPYGNVNVYRIRRAVNNPYSVKSEGQSAYIQDTWTMGQLTVNAGLRAEKWEHYASDGSKTATFDWEIAPRLSVVYDIRGDGRSKVFGFAGRYYDPIRNNMSDFAGALTGPEDFEEVNIYGTWVSYRPRGGATTPDALFSPATRTPYTDEFLLGYSTTIGRSIGVTASVTRRKTRDILEDFDLGLYSDPNATAADGAHGVAYPGSLFYLPLSYFGYSAIPNSNYVIGTLPGGKRDYTGFELTVTKYRTDNWFGQASYTHNSAKGNSNSDSNADYQGDWIALDPRAPNTWGEQPGNIKHQFKAYAGYAFDFGLEVSGVFNWNSGALYTPAQSVGGRYFAPMGPAYSFGGVTDTYFLPGYIGSEVHPSYYTFDVRLKYVHELPVGEAEFFLDVFNILDQQLATREMTLLAGSGQYSYGQASSWVAPRRAYLGVRYSF